MQDLVTVRSVFSKMGVRPPAASHISHLMHFRVFSRQDALEKAILIPGRSHLHVFLPFRQER